MALLGGTRPRSLARFPLPQGRYSRFLFEAALLFPAYFAYHLVRGAVNGRANEAFDNAAALIRLEQSLGIAWEIELQGLILSHHFLVTFFNAVYIWGHIPVIAGLALWVYGFRREHFARFRNAFLISGAIGLVFFVTVPMAPPRLIEDGAFVDTITLHTSAYRVLQPPALVNQYAAMPSLHFGWNLLMGIAVFQTTRIWWARAFGFFMPALMLAGIVFTANHYILDGVMGGAVALFALWLATQLHKKLQGTPAHSVLV